MARLGLGFVRRSEVGKEGGEVIIRLEDFPRRIVLVGMSFTV